MVPSWSKAALSLRAEASSGGIGQKQHRLDSKLAAEIGCPGRVVQLKPREDFGGRALHRQRLDWSLLRLEIARQHSRTQFETPKVS